MIPPGFQEIVYQWARTRFGVFDERPQSHEPLLYPVNSGEDYEGSRCSLQIPGTTINTLRPKQNGRLFADDIFICIFLNEKD